MLYQPERKTGAFTLVEIMIVVAIIALLASIAVPSFLRARKRSQASATLQTLRAIDGAKDQYAIENGKGGAITPLGTDLAIYVKKGSKLYTDLLANTPVDLLNGSITINSIDAAPQISSTTKNALSDALGSTSTAADAYWGAYK